MKPGAAGRFVLICWLAAAPVSAERFISLPGEALVPLPRGAATLNGFPVGRYPSHADFPETYLPPEALLEVRPDTAGTKVSTHFRIGQFLCKQPGGWPKYLALQKRLLTRLEQIVRSLAESNIDARHVVVMSGYRTPRYNAGLGNVMRSRHLYGDAADIYVDADGDGSMDDLNGDGLLDVQDAVWLARLIDRSTTDKLAGGLAVYPPNPHHGAFVHIDTRGKHSRWGIAF